MASITIMDLVKHDDWDDCSHDDHKAIELLIAGQFQAIMDEGLATCLPDGLFDDMLDDYLVEFDNYADRVGFEL